MCFRYLSISAHLSQLLLSCGIDRIVRMFSCMKTKDDALVAKTQGISDESQQTLYCPHTHTSLIVKRNNDTQIMYWCGCCQAVYNRQQSSRSKLINYEIHEEMYLGGY